MSSFQASRYVCAVFLDQVILHAHYTFLKLSVPYTNSRGMKIIEIDLQA